MDAQLDHLIWVVNDRQQTIDFYTRVLGLAYEGEQEPFSVIRLSAGCTLQVAPWGTSGGQHLALAVSPPELDAVFRRVRDANVPYGDAFDTVGNMRGPGDGAGARGPGKALYLFDPSRHLIEIRSYEDGAGARAGAAKRWRAFEQEQPDMAAAGRALLYQFRVGLGYLATVRKDGGPRVHPVCPVVAHGGLYVFVGNRSPKRGDLLRDGRFALHAFPNPEVDDEFFVAGRVARVDDAEVRRVVYEAYTSTGAFTSDDTLFELLLERALHSKYGPRPSWPPAYTRWTAA